MMRKKGVGISVDFVFLSLVCLSLGLFHNAHASHRYEFIAKGAGAHVQHEHWHHVLGNCIKEGRWRVLGYMSKKALEEHLSYEKLKQVAEDYECAPMKRALRSALLLKRISKGLQLRFGDLVEIALFIETSLGMEIEKHGTYLSRARTGLAAIIEFDPKTERTFIHLGLNKATKLGEGRKKVVTKSLMYHKTHPEVVAHCITEHPIPEEIEALQELHNLPGMMKMLAHTQRVNGRGKTVYAIMCKYYNGGTFAQKVKRKSCVFSLKQKLQIAHDILTGLASMHSKGFVHRDLNLRNCFFNIIRKGKHKRYKGIVADMGRAIPIKRAVGIPAQGNPYYIAPEGVTFHRMKNEDYYHADIYAMGCVLHQLFYKSRGQWTSTEYTRDCTLPPEARKNRFIWKLNTYRRERFRHLLKRGSYHLTQSSKERIERLILRMIDPCPENRGSAEELKEMMRFILDDYIKSKKH